MTEVKLGRDGEPTTNGANLPEKTRREELSVLLNKALNGELPRHRELKPEEPNTLSPAHIQILLFKAGGMKQRAIAELLDYTEGRVSTICNHPDFEYLLHKILGYAADNALDVPTRLRAGSGEMLDIVAEVARDPDTDKKEKLKAAFGWLDRAGHGKVETQKHEHEVNVSEEGAKRLSGAIKEAMALTGEDVSRFVVSGDERVSSESQATRLLQSGPASTDEPPIRGSDTGATPLEQEQEENVA